VGRNPHRGKKTKMDVDQLNTIPRRCHNIPKSCLDKPKSIAKHFLLILWVAIPSCTPISLERAGSEAVNDIVPELIKHHIFFLASDSLKGRNTPSAQLETAAQYIAAEFKANGLEPVNGSYFHKVGLNIISLGDDNDLKITRNGIEKSYEIKSEFTPFDMTGNKEAEGLIVFAGYGITAPEYTYDDYKDIDVKGKIVVVLRHEPGEEDTSSAFAGTRATDYSNVADKVRIALEHGAIGVMVATDPFNHALLTPRGFPWPSLSKFLPKDALPITLGTDEAKKVPVVHIGEEAISLLFGSVDSLRKLQVEIDLTMKPHSFELIGASASMKTSTYIKDMSSQNVVGFIQGTDTKLKNEIVVIGAHYDHVGFMKNPAPGTDGIFNGADDNASGTSAVLAVAAAFGSTPVRPKRSVLLMTFAAEEKGLLGSRAYVDNPLFPLEQTVAMINMDMVGRNNEDSLYVVGPSRSPDLAQINSEENQHIGFILVSDDRVIGGSDHMSFLRKNIPFIFYFTGFHPQYHQVTDHADLISTTKIARVARLAFRTAWRIANDDKRYRVINP